MQQQSIPRCDAAAATIAPDVLDLDAACEYVRSNAKPMAEWRMGLEYELIGFERGSYQRISRTRVQELLRSLIASRGIPTFEDTSIVALRMPYGDVTLEPGGQIEFSGFPERTLDENELGLQSFLSDLRELASNRGVFFVALGFDPLRNLDEQSWIDKQRYRIMKPYLRHRGGHAWDMMTRTAAMQVSLDYSDDEDLGRKYVLGNRLGPIIAAMFANSPFAGGVATGLKSTRYAVWLDTDPDRTGPGAASLSERFDLRECVSELLAVPAFFVVRNGKLIACTGQRLEDVVDARSSDFRELLSMIFTEARIREYVEMRSADGGHPIRALALMALWKGLTYDSRTLEDALTIAPHLDRSGFRGLQMAVARDALAARAEGVDVLAIARETVRLAIAGLQGVAPADVHYLDVVAQSVIDDGVSPADILLKDCGSDVERAMQSAAVA